MEYIVGAIIIGVCATMVWLFIKVFFIGWEVPTSDNELEMEQGARTARRISRQPRYGAKRVIVDVPESPYNLKTSDGVTCSVVGSTHWTTPEEKSWFTGELFFLRREPTNEFDSDAIAVYAGMQKFGYLSASMAARYAPLLDQLGGTFVVKRDLTTQRLALIMPRVGDLRKMIPVGRGDEEAPPHGDS